ncbi:MAG: flagellar basal-body MS-ring/collar protein FliF [Abditibacteriales bacterium]|nr:flagellar basal-body MS-ring/collar protein FliF [Abditibacteriales bacterium]MDW8365989.1 flagellar basal-body MS-ring/collar protein FliF [Abditibacteriales bacterium]
MNFLAQLQRAWGNLTVGQQRVLIGMGAVTAVGLVLLVMWASRPEYRPLFTNLTEADAAAVTAKLDERNVPYRLSDGGSTVLVPRHEVDALRLQMARDRVLKGTNVGFETWDETPLGLTESLIKIKRQRAMQGELERTIMAMEGVEAARVHLTQPEESPYLDTTREPTAAVTLKLKAGHRLSPSQVEAITYLVSYAVEGLSPQNVSVMDSHMNLLTGTVDPVTGTSDFATKQAEIQRQQEERIRNDIQTMLAQVLGPNKSVVRVRVEMDFDRMKTTKKTVQPAENGKGVPTMETEKEETYKGTSAPPAGVPGTTSAAGVPTLLARAQNTVNNSLTSRQTSTQYEVSTENQTIDKAVGTIKRLTVSVVVNHLPPRKTVAEMQAMVASAAGVNPARGDIVNVTVAPFDTTHLAAEKRALEQAQRQELYLTIARGILMGLVVLVALVVGSRLFAPAVPRGTPRPIEAPEPPALPESLAPSLPAEEEPALPSEEVSSPPPTPEVEAMEVETLQPTEEELQVHRLAQERPEEVARLLRIWLKE